MREISLHKVTDNALFLLFLLEFK